MHPHYFGSIVPVNEFIWTIRMSVSKSIGRFGCLKLSCWLVTKSQVLCGVLGKIDLFTVYPSNGFAFFNSRTFEILLQLITCKYRPILKTFSTAGRMHTRTAFNKADVYYHLKKVVFLVVYFLAIRRCYLEEVFNYMILSDSSIQYGYVNFQSKK